MTPQALVVVDFQHAFVTGALGVPDAEAVVATLQDLVDRARAVGALVAHLEDVGDDDSPVPPGGPERDLVIETRPGEPVVRKSSGDGFDGTDLERVLRSAGVTALVIGGVHSDGCVAATLAGAQACGLDVVLPYDAHASRDRRGGGGGDDGDGPAAAEVRFEAPPAHR